MTKDDLLQQMLAAYTGPGSTEEGSFAGDVLRACADTMAQLWSMEIDGLERKAFVSTAVGAWLTRVCADRGVERRPGEDDDTLRQRTLAKLATQPASGNADHYAAWCTQVPEILRVSVLPLARGAGTVDVIAVGQDGKAPSPTVLAAAQAVIDAERPVGADAQIFAAAETPLHLTAAVTLMDDADLTTVQELFTATLAEFCKDNALKSPVVSYAKILRLLLDTTGVADVTECTLNGGEDSLSLSDTTVPVVGSVSLTEVA